MSDKNLSFNDKSRDEAMSDTEYAQDLIKDAFPRWRFGKVDACIFEATEYVSKRVKKRVTPRRMRSIWEGTARRIDAEERDALEQAKLEGLRYAQTRLRTRLAEIDEALAAFDQGKAR